MSWSWWAGGPRGALLLERGQAVLHQPDFPVPAASGGGAGDTLAAAFAHFYLSRHRAAPGSLRLACAAAALTLGSLGGGEGHPDEVAAHQLAGS